MKFRSNFSPFQLHKPDLTYIEGNPYVIISEHLIKFNVEFKFMD